MKGRPPSCICGTCAKCRARARARERYRSMTLDERRAWIARRDKDAVREADRRRSRTPKRKAHLTANTRRWRKEHPERMRAHNAVARALRNGRLVRAACEVCADPNTHAHHGDYSKPLDVRWLCAIHHAEETKAAAA